MKRILINGSFEPTWRRNARADADKFKSELMSAVPSRRAFLAGAGAALMLEYVAQRRAVAFPFPHGSASGGGGGVTGITNARTGLTYQYIPDALMAMADGDTLLLPAGQTYQYLGGTMYYAHYLNTNPYGTYGTKNIYLGHTSPYLSTSSADYGTIQGSGTANNGRALVAPTWGVLSADYHIGDTDMLFDPAYPVSNFPGFLTFLYVPVFGDGTFAGTTMTYTGGKDLGANKLTGVTGNFAGTIPMGTVISTFVGNEGKAIFVPAGGNPGWTLNNLELAYVALVGGISSSVQQQTCNPGGPYVGSMTLNNCFIHDCNQGPGLGYAGIGNAGGIFAHMFDTEITRGGVSQQTHNIYIGHISEFVMDNCYSHNVVGAWLVKARAALNILTYNQIRGEQTDVNSMGGEAGCDFSNGGLTYLIGNIHQSSLHPGNLVINYAAESNFFGSDEGGSCNQHQELYAVNQTMIGADLATSALVCPVRIYGLGVHPPPITLLNQTNGGSFPARQYWVEFTSAGALGGETPSTQLAAPVGGWVVYENLNVSTNKLLTVASAEQMTGAGGWNCYANYGDPPLYQAASFTAEGNNFFWDAGLTQPVFDFTSGGTTISVTGTLTNGSNVITGLTGLSGLGSLSQLMYMTPYVGGIMLPLTVWSVDLTNNSLTMTGFSTYSGATGSATITFGYFLWSGITYQTALGDSVNAALDYPSWLSTSIGGGYYDGSYTFNNVVYVVRPFVQVPPGQKLIVNAPPSGPTWATGINFWATPVRFSADFSTGPSATTDAGILGFTKQNSSPVAFAGSFTTPVGVIAQKAQLLRPNMLLQNASPISPGIGFIESGTSTIDPNSGLVNNNPTKTKLQWFRRASMQHWFGGTISCWYAVVPGGGLSGYSDSLYVTSSGTPVQGSISVWRGCAADPFDGNFQNPAPNGYDADTITTAGGNVTVLAGFVCNRTAGTGFTQISTAAQMNAEYKSSVAQLVAFSVTESGGALQVPTCIDVLAGSVAPPTLIDTVAISSSAAAINYTIAAANAGDILYMMVGSGSFVDVQGIGRIGTPIVSSTTDISPTVLIQNCLSANFLTTTGGWVCMNDGEQTVPVGYVTLQTNLQANPSNGATYGAPLWATVFADSVQADYDYRLAVASPAKNSASDPGSSTYGQDLIPHYQVNWVGLPTPGTPIPAKAARTDIGPALTGSIGALT